ncbi:MAG TPA: histidine kinase [Chitinophagaceae bacterium]|nr:histidine kinase [Chitinophagaceae bacterium]
MVSSKIIKKLCFVALYSAPVIAALAITPLFIVSGYTEVEYLWSILLITALVLFMWAVNILLYYITNRRKKSTDLLRYTFSYFFCVVCTVVAVTWFFGEFRLSGSGHHSAVFHFHLVAFLSINTVVLILQDLVLVRKKNEDIEHENLQLRMKNMEAINQQLKHQVQPHFLFNSLSTLKALIKTDAAKAEEYLVKLSDFLRYSVSSGRVNMVKVKEELKLCIDYLQMQQIRFGGALQFAINVPGDIQQAGQVPIFSLQVLIENAIKHNTFTVPSPLVITVDYRDGWIEVSNNLQPLAAAQEAGGIGLANLAERYKMLAAEDIVIKNTGDTFLVRIKVL